MTLSIRYHFPRQTLEEVKASLAHMGEAIRIEQDANGIVTGTVFTENDAVLVRTFGQWGSERWFNGDLHDRLDGPATTIRRADGDVHEYRILGLLVTTEEHAVMSKMAIKSIADAYYAKRGLADGLDPTKPFNSPEWARFPTVKVHGESNWSKVAEKVIKATGREGLAKVAKGPKLRGTYAVVCATDEVAHALAKDLTIPGTMITDRLDHHVGRQDYEPTWRKLANDDGQWPWEAK